MELLKFEDRLYNLIKESTKYCYPETKEEFFPNFEKPCKIENSWFKNRKKYKAAVKTLKRNYDLEGLEFTYNNLADEYSKEMFLKVIARPLFDEISIRFPLYYSNAWKNMQRYEKFIIKRENMEVLGQPLHVYNLKELGHDINILTSYFGIFIDFDLEQYRYKNEVFVQEGDYVIDGGAYAGDTAVYFADLAKENGKVFSFEFMKENLELYNRNIGLNPKLKDRIELIKRPLGANSLNKFYAVESGPGSYLTTNKPEGFSEEYTTISIDDFVKENSIEKIDFIKLDIEGAELETLRGAMETIKKHKPNIAVCLYHKLNDLWEIPKFLKEILPEYDLYLDHFTTMQWETVLFAKVKK